MVVGGSSQQAAILAPARKALRPADNNPRIPGPSSGRKGYQRNYQDLDFCRVVQRRNICSDFGVLRQPCLGMLQESP